ncbi:MAG: Gfo/Idh/MocA family protein [Candidatus Zipacnadales bacterium]
MTEVRLGLISCGNMGRSLITSTREIPHCLTVCVADVDEEKARTLAEEMSCEYVTDNAALLARDDIDAVIIAAPNFLHRCLVEQAAAAGKHIFCEKPLALTTTDAKAMVQAAQDAGVKLMVGQVLRYLAPWHYLKAMVDRGELGQPFGMQTTRIGGGWGGGHYHAQWRLKRETCGGPLFEINAHEIDFMRQIMGKAKRVTAGTGRFVETEIDYEDLAMVFIEFENGGYGQLLAGHCSQIGIYDARLFCTNGTVFCQPPNMRYRRRGEEEVVVSAEEMQTEPGVQREVREFVECILNNTEPTIPGTEGVRNVEIAEAALISAAEHRPVDLPL